MTLARRRRTTQALLCAAATLTLLLLHAPSAFAASGSITNVRAVGGNQVEATYTTNMDICSGTYCGWYPHAWQVPATQSCTVDKSHLTYVGTFQSTSGTQTATDTFYPAFGTAPIRLCLYAYQDGNEHYIADAVYTPTGTTPTTTTPTPPVTGLVSGSITNVRPTTTGKYVATYTTNFSQCTSSGYCGWYPRARQVPATQQCSPGSTKLTYVGDVHGSAGSETATDTFYPAYTGRTRLCLYARQSGVDHFVAQTTFTPRSTTSSGSTTQSSGGVFTLTRAQRAVRTALTRRFGTAFTRGTSYRRTCRRRSNVRFRCTVSWRRGVDRYAGTVTVWVHTPRSTHIHYSIRLVRTRPA